jgi:hypothetical protein
VAHAPHNAPGHGAEEQQSEAGGEGDGSWGGEETAPRGLERSDGEWVWNDDRCHDPVGESRRGTQERQRGDLIGDVPFHSQLLETDLALVYVTLQCRRERSGKPRVDLIGGEMRSGRTGHKWTLLR